MAFAIPPLQSDTRLAFHGRWELKYWKNIPGPFYSTTDNCLSLLAFGDDRDHLFFDDQCEFVWRQPASIAEFQTCLGAMRVDEIGSYQIDGNEHWAPESIRAWWRRKLELIEWVKTQIARPLDDPTWCFNRYPEQTGRRLLTQYMHYLNKDAEEYLRSYIFLLENGMPATTSSKLPLL